MSGESSTEERCPFAGLNANSQVIRRQDLIDLGDSFRKALDPLGQLVETLQRQAAYASRLQAWLVIVAALSTFGILLHLSALYALYTTAQDLQETAARTATIAARLDAQFSTSVVCRPISDEAP